MIAEFVDVIQGDIRYRDSDHSYLHIPTKKKLTSVTQVIKVVYATKSWDGKDDETPEDTQARLRRIKEARLRGIEIDRLMTQLVTNGEIRGDAMPEVRERIVIAHRILEEEFPGLPIEAQKIVSNVEDGVAGMMDFWIDGRILVDLKATYAVEKDWILQIGAYADMAPSVPERAGILHVSPKLYKEEGGGIFMDYDVDACRRYWRHALEWWKTSNGMAQAVKVSRSKNRS